MESSTTASSYFKCIQRLYTFFSTPKRWNVLSSRLKEAGHVVIKRLCSTRWSSHTYAVSALSDGYSIVLDVINKMKKYNLNALSLIELNYLYKRMNEFETVLLCKIWKALLCRINAVSKILQYNSIESMVAVNNLVALSNYIDKKRNNYEEFICMAEHVCKAEFNESKKRIQIAKKYFDDEPLNTNESITPKERFKPECFLPIFDNLISNYIVYTYIYIYIY